LNHRTIFYFGLLSVVSCVHPSTSAERYQAEGNFSLAMEYKALAYEMDGREDTSALIRGIELARVGFNEQLEGCDNDSAYERGHAIVTEWVEFERWIARLRIPGLPPQDLTKLSEMWRQRAGRELVEEADSSTDEGRALQERLKLLRHALALNPSDQALSKRYERLKSALSRDVEVVFACEPSLGQICDELRAIWLELFSRVRHELVHMVSPKSPRFDTRITVSISSRETERPWYPSEELRHEAEVQLFNQYREPLKDADGENKTMTVRANSVVEESWRKVEVAGTLKWQDLRNADSLPREFSSRRRHQSLSRYLRWKGDVRALEPSQLLEQVGTNRRDPLALDVLQRRGVSEVVTELFGQWMKEAEK